MNQAQRQAEQKELEHEQACNDMEQIISEAKTPELKLQFKNILQGMKDRHKEIQKWEAEFTCSPFLCRGYPPEVQTPLGYFEPCPKMIPECVGSRRAVAIKERDIDRLMKTMRISQDGINYSKNYNELPHIASIKFNWLRALQQGRAIIISGVCETGKTVAACVLMRMYLDLMYDKLKDRSLLQNYSCGYWTLRGLLMRMESKRYEERESFINYLSALNFLVLDDIGSLPDPKRYVPMIIDAREGDHRFTCLTTNIEIEKWAEIFGERTASRMTGARWSLQIETAEASLRQDAYIDEDLF